MKKFGFTLSEIIITLGIIGVVAAITAPSIENLIPDKNKVKALKAHKMLSDVNTELLNNQALYWLGGGTSTCKGFVCTAKPRSGYSADIYSGNSKYLALVIAHMNVIDSSKTVGSSKGSFETADGMTWDVDGASVVVDVDKNGSNCFWSSTCTKPDRFKFIVNLENGEVIGNDPLTQAYLANPLKLNDRKKDLKVAKDNTTTPNPNTPSTPGECIESHGTCSN